MTSSSASTGWLLHWPGEANSHYWFKTCALCPVPCALLLVPCALCPVPCALLLVPCALCPVPCALCPVPCACALCPVPCALCPKFPPAPLPALPEAQLPMTPADLCRLSADRWPLTADCPPCSIRVHQRTRHGVMLIRTGVKPRTRRQRSLSWRRRWTEFCHQRFSSPRRYFYVNTSVGTHCFISNQVLTWSCWTTHIKTRSTSIKH